MTRMVHCKKYNKELPGLPVPPYPGQRGQEIYQTISQQAWSDWQQQQTMLINEKQLSMAKREDRQYLQEQMDKFLSGEEFDQAEGYIPEQK